jgi:hypothetical protein
MNPLTAKTFLKRLVAQAGPESKPLWMPAEIRLFDNPNVEAWGDVVADECERRLLRAEKAMKMEVPWQDWFLRRKRIQLTAGMDAELTTINRGKRFTWLLDRGRIGAGELIYDKEYGIWYVRTAVIRTGYRGSGFYPLVLDYIRKSGITVHSDRKLSRAALQVWKRIGKYWPDVRRFKINPPVRVVILKRTEIQDLTDALNYFATEGPRSDRY